MSPFLPFAMRVQCFHITSSGFQFHLMKLIRDPQKNIESSFHLYPNVFLFPPTYFSFPRCVWCYLCQCPRSFLVLIPFPKCRPTAKPSERARNSKFDVGIADDQVTRQFFPMSLNFTDIGSGSWLWFRGHGDEVWQHGDVPLDSLKTNRWLYSGETFVNE